MKNKNLDELTDLVNQAMRTIEPDSAAAERLFREAADGMDREPAAVQRARARNGLVFRQLAALKKSRAGGTLDGVRFKSSLKDIAREFEAAAARLIADKGRIADQWRVPLAGLAGTAARHARHSEQVQPESAPSFRRQALQKPTRRRARVRTLQGLPARRNPARPERGRLHGRAAPGRPHPLLD